MLRAFGKNEREREIISHFRHFVRTLLEADNEVGVRYRVACALGNIGDASSVDALIASLKDDEPSVRSCAAKALGKIGDKRAFEPLLSLFDDKAIYPRAYATEALGRVGEPLALDPLVKKLNSDDDSWVRSMAAKGLGHLQDVRAEPALLAACDDASSRVRVHAKAALSALHRD